MGQTTGDRNRHRQSLLHVEHIEKYYGSPGAVTKALDQVSFDVRAGEFISIMGASGSGKTTLLNCISTIDTISEVPPQEIDRRVRRIAERLRVGDVLRKFPTQVSGGQKQRCAFARAVICDPKLIMADEPTGALDSNASRTLLEVMADFNKDMGATILMVTHDAFCASYAGRILFLKDGRIFNEIFKGEKTRSTFYHEILDVLSALGGDRPC